MSFWGSSMLTRWNTWGSESLWLRSLFLSWGQQINPSQGVFSGSSLPAFPVHVWLYTCPCQWLWAWALFVFLTCLSVPLKEEGLAVVWPLAGLVFPGPCWPMGKSPLPFQNLYTAKHKTEITCLVLLEILLPTLLDWFFRCPEIWKTDTSVCIQAVVAGIQQAHAEQLANMRIQELKVSLKPLHSVNNPILRKRKLLG